MKNFWFAVTHAGYSDAWGKWGVWFCIEHIQATSKVLAVAAVVERLACAGYNVQTIKTRHVNQ